MKTIDEISAQLDTLQELILSLIPNKRRPHAFRKVAEPVNLSLFKLRQAALMTTFQRLATLGRAEKRARHFPVEIIPPLCVSAEEAANTPNPQIVPMSLIRNRLLQLAPFKLREGETDIEAVLGETFAASDLVVASIAECGIRLDGANILVMTADEARGMSWRTREEADIGPAWRKNQKQARIEALPQLVEGAEECGNKWELDVSIAEQVAAGGHVVATEEDEEAEELSEEDQRQQDEWDAEDAGLVNPERLEGDGVGIRKLDLAGMLAAKKAEVAAGKASRKWRDT